MNNQEKEFNKIAEAFKGVSLSVEEKSAMLESIYKYEVVGEELLTTKSIPSPFIYSSFFKRRTLLALTGVFLMTASTSYASFASMGSLPGDPLYQMKVGILEPIGVAVRFKEEEKNNYRVELLRERVAEIERLKETGRLMPHNEIESSRAAQRNIIEIEASPAFDAKAKNSEINIQVETYNSIVMEEERKLKTIVKKILSEEMLMDETSATTSPEDDTITTTSKNKKVKKVEDVVEELTKPAEEVATPVVEDVTEEVKDVVKETAPIELPKILNSIGL